MHNIRPTFISILLFISAIALAVPTSSKDGRVKFTFSEPDARIVYIAGGFNRWNPDGTPMEKGEDGDWTIALELEPGAYQYKFVVNGNDWRADPENPATADDNHGGVNSAFVLTEDGRVLLESKALEAINPDDEYPEGPSIYLSIIWHQHQPLYADPAEDYLSGPWVRLHATKDYFDMAAMTAAYPNIHLTFNLTSVLLQQLQKYYVERLGEVVRGNEIDEKAYFADYAGRTDPWIDLLLKDTGDFTSEDEKYLTGGAWNCFGISEVMLERFPEYAALKEKGGGLSTEEKLRLKVWFALAWFDPDFLNGKVDLVTGESVDLSDLVEFRGGKWLARRPFTEDDANRLVAESYKVMAAVVPEHKRLMDEARGEIITTPYYHPILPLIQDSDIARICQPGTPMPARFSFPGDAGAQVIKGASYYQRLFGRPTFGMWPGEGAVSEQIIGAFTKSNIIWIATADGVLGKSTPPGGPIWRPYRVDTDNIKGRGEGSRSVAVFFRDTELSDRIGFKYQTKTGEDAAEDFVREVLSNAVDGKERHITVILDGENAWEWYRTSPDGKDFLHALYRKLEGLQSLGRIITVTPAEYILGNEVRDLPPHPIEEMPELEPLWPGSWINANFDTWIGEKEENIAWNMLRRVRNDLDNSGIERPNPHRPAPEDPRQLAEYNAWEAVYAAEGSDWFWWFGADQGAPGGDYPFDEGFRTHLANVYRYAREAGNDVEIPEFAPIIEGASGGGGAMARGKDVKVTFVVDAAAIKVTDAVYIAGEPPKLGSWTPNVVAMRDDGKRGDKKAGDGLWSLTVELPEGAYIEYKYTNSGTKGEWEPGEEFPSANRAITIEAENGVMVVKDVFGEM